MTTDMTNAAFAFRDAKEIAFAFRDAKEIAIGFARALCLRITYHVELGYELYVPTEQEVHVYDRLVLAGEAVGLRHAGLKSLASLRMEKGYRDYGHDMTIPTRSSRRASASPST